MGFLRGLLLEDLGIKLVALLLALALYLHVYTERTSTMTLAFTLEITDLADSLSLAGTPPEPVRAELRGTGKRLIRLRLTEPRIRISLAGVGPGRYERILGVDDLPLLANERLEVERLIGPRAVVLEVDRRLSKRVPVAVRAVGTPHAGWAWAGAYRTDPERVLVSGPRREVARIDSIRLRPVRIEGRADTVRARAAPESLPPWCTVDPEQVATTLPLVRTGGR